MRRLLFESALEKRKCREGVGEKNKIKGQKGGDANIEKKEETHEKAKIVRNPKKVGKYSEKMTIY